MKILLFSTSDSNGGAAIAAVRLMNALQISGHEVKMLVAIKTSEHPDIVAASSFFGTKAQKMHLAIEKGLFLLHEKNKTVRFQFSTTVSGFSVKNHPWVRWADILHFHWTQQGFLSLTEMSCLQSLGKPIVWTLHDMWAFTGGCHYAGDCHNYLKECGNCHYLKNPSSDDLSHRIFLKKRKVYRNLNFVTCSQWLGRLAKSSSLLSDFPVTAIPNPIDTDFYHPLIEKSSLRKQLGLDENKNYILFGAASITDERKGLKYFIEAMNLYKNTHADLPSVIIYGSQKHDVILDGYEVIHAGFLNQHELKQYYQLSNIYIITSLEDNLPNTVMEALACGLPVLSFNTGGIPEMVKHKYNGYIAEYKSTEDICKGLEFLLKKAELKVMSLESRKFCIENFTKEKIGSEYSVLYQNLLDSFNK